MADAPAPRRRPATLDDRIPPSAIFGVVAIAVLCMLAWAWRGALSRPFVMDEMEYTRIALAIQETAKPLVQRGIVGPSTEGLWQPPLYVLCLAGWQAVFGSGAGSRALGAFGACLTLILVTVVVKRRLVPAQAFWEHRFGGMVAVWFGLLTFLSPLLVQGATIPEVETQILPLVMTVFVLVLFELRRRDAPPSRYWAVFGAGIALLAFAKLSSPLLLLPALFTFERRRGDDGDQPAVPNPGIVAGAAPLPSEDILVVAETRPWHTGLAVVPAALAGFALMCGGWLLGAALWGVSFATPFSSASASLSAEWAAFGSWGAASDRLPGDLHLVASWIGIPWLAFLAFMVVREFGRVRPKDGILRRSERLAIYTFLLTILVVYIVWRPGPYLFPKYHVVMVPFLALLVIELLSSIWAERKLGVNGTVLILEVLACLSGAIAMGFYPFKDFMYEAYWGDPETATTFRDWMLVPLGAALLVNGVLWLLEKPRRRRTLAAWFASSRSISAPLAVGSLAVALSWNLVVTMNQARQTYSTTYYYGEETLEKTAAYLRTELPKDATPIVPKDLGALLTDKWRVIELTVDPRKSFSSPNASYLVLRENDAWGRAILETPEIASVVNARFDVVTHVGNFTVMRRR